MSLNGQTHFKNLAKYATRILRCVWLLWDIMNESVEPNYIIVSGFISVFLLLISSTREKRSAISSPVNRIFVWFSAKVIEPVVAVIQPNIQSISRTPSANVWISGLTSFEMVQVKKISSPQVVIANIIIATISNNMLYNLPCFISVILKHTTTGTNNENEIKPI